MKRVKFIEVEFGGRVLCVVEGDLVFGFGIGVGRKMEDVIVGGSG